MRYLTFLTISLSLTVASPEHLSGQAMDYYPTYPGAEMRQAALSGIALSEEQQRKLWELTYAVYRTGQDLQPVMQDAPLEVRRAKLRELIASHAKEIRATLSIDQQRVFDLNLANWQRYKEGLPQMDTLPSTAWLIANWTNSPGD